MEVLGMRAFADAYYGRRVLVTGHTGFKGSWLSLWLNSLGADVIGLALAPETSPSHWEQLKLPIADYRVDVRDEGRFVQSSPGKGRRSFSTWPPSRWFDGLTGNPLQHGRPT